MACSKPFRTEKAGVTWGSHEKKLRHDFAKNGFKKLRRKKRPLRVLLTGRHPLAELGFSRDLNRPRVPKVVWTSELRSSQQGLESIQNVPGSGNLWSGY